MRVRLVAILALLCACREEASIHRERITHEARTELTGISLDVRGHQERPKPAHLCELGARRGCFGTVPRPRVRREGMFGLGSYEGDTALLAKGARLLDVHLAVMP